MAQPERHLAALLSADVVGYGQLIARDETGTVETLEDRRRLLSSVVEQRGGRVVDSPGDNLLAEFPSAVEAVQCAVDFQRGVAERNADLPDQHHMRFRVGVHLGEVLVREGRLYGDGINVTARLERLAEPGGICLSRKVHDEVQGKLDVALEDLGEQELKNVKEPLRVFRVRAPGVASNQKLSSRATATLRVDTSDTATIRSVAVLPLSNLSGDPEQDYFADGVTEDLIGALSQIGALRIPSHRSVMRFKSSSEPLPVIASELGVDALIEGTVRRQGDQVRITVQLIQGATDEHLWHESYDESMSDILALQARIARSVANRVEVTLKPSEFRQLAAEVSVVPAAYDAYLRARQIDRLQRGWASPEVIPLLEQAVALDPEFTFAHHWLAQYYFANALFQHAPAKDLMPKARSQAIKALDLGAVEANYVLGSVAAFYDWDWVDAQARYQKVREARPRTLYAAFAQATWGMILCFQGQWESGLEQLRECASVDPLYLLQAYFHEFEARARRYDAAIEGAKALLAIEPNLSHAKSVLWFAYWWKGEFDEAVPAHDSYLKHWGIDPGALSAVYREGGFGAYLRAYIHAQQERWKSAGVASMIIAMDYAYLGEADLAFEWLERAYEERDPLLLHVFNTTPAFDPIRSDPRFTALAERVGLPLVEPDGPLVAPLPD